MDEDLQNINHAEEPYDIAFRWGWETPQFHQLVYWCYKTPNLTENAHRYWESSEFQEVLKILTELGKGPGQQIKLLDFSCGNGVACYALARSGYQVIGLDASNGELVGINAARKIQNLDGVSFELRQAAGETINFPDNTFDVVWMREVLHHMNDLTGFLMEVKRVLNPSGIICCLRDPVIWNEDQYQDFFKTHPFHPITKDENCYYLDQYLTSFQNAGLIVERLYHPYSTVINTYPSPYHPGKIFDEHQARLRTTGYDLYSFFMRKPEKL